MRGFILLMAALITTVGVHAETYRWQDAQGLVHYGDDPPEGALGLREVKTFECTTKQCEMELQRRYEEALAAEHALDEWLREREAARRQSSSPAESATVYIVPQWLPVPYAAFFPGRYAGHPRTRHRALDPSPRRPELYNQPRHRVRTRFAR